jgi:hypothetical protein
MKKKTTKPSPKKKAVAKKAKPKIRRKPAVPAETPTLRITVESDCTLTNNQHLNPPHASKSANGGFPNHIQFDGKINAWFCLPAGYLSPEPVSPFEVGPHLPAVGFKVRDNLTSSTLHYQHSCDKPCVPDSVENGDEIILDA